MSDRYKSEFERELSQCLGPAHAPESLWSRVEAGLHPRPARPVLPVVWGLLIAASLTAAWYVERPSSVLAIHREFMSHPERLDLVKCQPAELHDWIARNTGLAVTLAAHHQLGPARLEIVGARRVDSGKAAVFYRVDGYPVTLLVSRGDAEGGPAKIVREARSEDVKLFTWEAHGQRYTMISSLPGNSRQECVICHVGGTRG